MNRSGFTTVEVVIASALIVTLITGGAIGMRQVGLLGQMATTRTAHTEMRTRILEALSDSSTCAIALGKGTATAPFLPDPMNPPAYPGASLPVANISSPATGIFLETAVPTATDPGKTYEQLQYTLSLSFPSGPVFETFPPSTGRPTTTVRHLAQLDVQANRHNLKEQGGATGALQASIPISLEFDTGTGLLSTCSIIAGDVEDYLDVSLLGNQHTVRDCLKDDGYPMPTDIGLICRLSIPVLNSPTYAGTIPPCPGTWKPAIPAPGINYNTTLSRDARGQGCSGAVQFKTGWHYFSKLPVESQTQKVKKGTSGLLKWASGGAAFAAAAFIGAIAGIIGLIIFVIILTKCKSENFTLYSQVNGIGCI